MVEQFRDFLRYYRGFSTQFGSEFYQSWKPEIASGVVIAALVFVVSYRHDPNAKTAFVYTIEACAIMLGGWATYHLIRAPWKLSSKRDKCTTCNYVQGRGLRIQAGANIEIRSVNGLKMLQTRRICFGNSEQNALQRLGELTAQIEACKKWDFDTLGMYLGILFAQKKSRCCDSQV